MKSLTELPAFHRLAGQTIWIEPGLPELQPFRQAGQSYSPLQIPQDLPFLAENSPALRATGWVADRFSTVSLWEDEHGTLLEIPEVGRFWTATDGSAIFLVTRFPDVDPTILGEGLLGPPLVLALALRNTWCLHASAVEYQGRVIAFLGGSGAGKSTLAAYLADQPGVRRVADDILPVARQDGGISALPHFPQLKLPIPQQPGNFLREYLPMLIVYILDEQPAISIEALEPGNSALLVAGQTVAARIFNRGLLARHLTFCSRAASDLPARRLAYPRHHSELPGVWKALQDDLAFRYA